MNQMTSELTGILFSTQYRLHYKFSLRDVYDILRYTIRKAEYLGRGKEYIPLLFEDELRNHVARIEINRRSF